MTEKITDSEQSRRTFIRTTAGVGAAATGVGALAGGAAAQQQNLFDIGDVTVTDVGGGLVDVDVTLTNIAVNVDALNNLSVRVRDVLQNIEVLTDNVVTVTLENIQIGNANNIVVLVQALSAGGAVLDTDRQVVRQ